jgi:iron complex transport system substrate-binding protein
VGATKARAAVAGAAFVVGVCLSLVLGRLQPPAPAGSLAGGGQERAGARYRRVVCMSPAVTEIVFAIGAGERVVGVCQHVKYPPEALDRPLCGGFFNPDFERLLSLQPDLIITQGEAEHLARFARDNRIQVLSLMLTDLDSILRETERVGAALDAGPQADLLCAELRYRLARVRAAVSGRPQVRTALVVAREPGALSNIQVVGPGTFLNDLLEMAGGRNVFSDLAQPYGVVSKEALGQRAPEVIVEMHGEGAEPGLQDEVRGLWRGLPSLPAVQQDRVYAVEATYAMIPGPRVVQLAELLADLLHRGEQK